MRWLLVALTMLALPAKADGEAGVFDYYVMALSWSPSWCAETGDARRSEQCERSLGFILHGLWPQYEDGYPADCQSGYAPPSRRETADMADIMGTSGLAWYQWNKHGSCSGLAPQAYYRLAREAYESVEIPQAFRALTRDVTLPAALIEEAFLDKNPDLTADSVTITCRDGAIQETRICLTKELEPRTCGADVIRDCTLKSAAFRAID